MKKGMTEAEKIAFKKKAQEIVHRLRKYPVGSPEYRAAQQELFNFLAGR